MKPLQLIKGWLPTKGDTENWHEDFIVHLARIIRPKTYVELGLYQCSLFNKIEPFASTLIGLDIKPEAEAFMKQSSKTKFVLGTTDKFALKLRKSPISIDMLFIDADHSRKSVLNDFKNFFPFVVDQGIIILHDGYPKDSSYTRAGYCGDCYLAIQELTEKAPSGGYEIMTIPVHPGLTICRKRVSHLPNSYKRA